MRQKLGGLNLPDRGMHQITELPALIVGDGRP
jgi:hypothetical protein